MTERVVVIASDGVTAENVVVADEKWMIQMLRFGRIIVIVPARDNVQPGDVWEGGTRFRRP